MIEIVNRQRAYRVAERAVALFAADLLRARALALAPREVEIAFLSEARIRDLNRTYRGKDRGTDVLSFTLDDPPDPSGVLAICPARVERNVVRTLALRPTDANLSRELGFLILHGLLHLAGHDHGEDYEGSEMAGVANRILRGRTMPHGLLRRRR